MALGTCSHRQPGRHFSRIGCGTEANGDVERARLSDSLEARAEGGYDDEMVFFLADLRLADDGARAGMSDSLDARVDGGNTVRLSVLLITGAPDLRLTDDGEATTVGVRTFDAIGSIAKSEP